MRKSTRALLGAAVALPLALAAAPAVQAACGPCKPKAAKAKCGPCGAKKQAKKNPCGAKNPCAAKNPCGAKKK